VEESTAKNDYMQSSLINPLLRGMKLEKMLSLFLCQYPLKQGWQTFVPIRSAKYLANFFSSTMFPTVDSSATALAATCLLMTCLSQQHLAASSAIKV